MENSCIYCLQADSHFVLIYRSCKGVPAIFAANKSSTIDKRNPIVLIAIRFPKRWLIEDEACGSLCC